MSINRAFDRGELSGAKLGSGHRRISRASLAEWSGLDLGTDDTAATDDSDSGTLNVIYARCSQTKQSENLSRQVERLKEWAVENLPGEKYVVVAEIGSGANNERRGLLRVLDYVLAGKAKRVVVEFGDRLSRSARTLIYRICEKCGVEIVETRTGQEEWTAKTLQEEMVFDTLALLTVFSAKVSGSRAAAAVRFVAPEGFAERVATLYGQGLGKRAMIAAIKAENWRCSNTNRVIGEHGIRLTLKSIRNTLPKPARREKRQATPGPVPACLTAFIKERCRTGAGKKVLTSEVWEAFAAFSPADAEKFTRRKFTDLLKSAVERSRVERGENTRHVFYGLALRG